MVRVLVMVLQILLYHPIRHRPGTERRLPDTPKVFTPISFAQLRKFFLNPFRRPPLQSPDNLTDRQARWIRNVQMHMILAHSALDYLDIIRITDLSQNISNPIADFLRQHLVAVFGDPYQVDFQIMNGMCRFPIRPHDMKLY